jgi:hypothetical protein
MPNYAVTHNRHGRTQRDAQEQAKPEQGNEVRARKYRALAAVQQVGVRWFGSVLYSLVPHHS